MCILCVRVKINNNYVFACGKRKLSFSMRIIFNKNNNNVITVLVALFTTLLCSLPMLMVVNHSTCNNGFLWPYSCKILHADLYRFISEYRFNNLFLGSSIVVDICTTVWLIKIWMLFQGSKSNIVIHLCCLL